MCRILSSEKAASFICDEAQSKPTSFELSEGSKCLFEVSILIIPSTIIVLESFAVINTIISCRQRKAEVVSQLILNLKHIVRLLSEYLPEWMQTGVLLEIN